MLLTGCVTPGTATATPLHTPNTARAPQPTSRPPHFMLCVAALPTPLKTYPPVHIALLQAPWLPAPASPLHQAELDAASGAEPGTGTGRPRREKPVSSHTAGWGGCRGCVFVATPCSKYS